MATFQSIKDTSFPNNLFLEVKGFSWRDSEKIMPLTPDHLKGAKSVFKSLRMKFKDDFILKKRFEDKMSYKELSADMGISETKCNQLVKEQIECIRESAKYYSYITKGYDYTNNFIDVK